MKLLQDSILLLSNIKYRGKSNPTQKDRRPAIIISNKVFNQDLGLAFTCPEISFSKKYLSLGEVFEHVVDLKEEGS